MPVSKLVFIFVPVRELVWFPNSDWRVYLSFHSGSISAQTEILVWELGPSAQTGINESQFANWDPSSRTGTVRILGLTYVSNDLDLRPHFPRPKSIVSSSSASRDALAAASRAFLIAELISMDVICRLRAFSDISISIMGLVSSSFCSSRCN